MQCSRVGALHMLTVCNNSYAGSRWLHTSDIHAWVAFECSSSWLQLQEQEQIAGMFKA